MLKSSKLLLVLISLQRANGQTLYEEEKRKLKQEREIEEEEEEEEENDKEKEEEQEERKRKAVEEEELKEFIEQKNDKVGLSPLLMINLWCQPNSPELEIIARTTARDGLFYDWVVNNKI
jgi:beta-phosphoglucomutase-like phosphatase (HAD superfamily)